MLVSKEKREHIILLFIIFLIFYFLLAYRLYNIQVVQKEKFEKIAQEEHITSLTLEGERGNIYDRNHKKLALNVSTQSLFAIPCEIKNPHDTAQKISSILNLGTK
ncbi:MAG: stage V sporulation protein D, partial [Candidatus Caldatribacteriota bacterium]|nr:stage V sporulation protein D [Candidatus Caldatribacteriota bacterium]